MDDVHITFGPTYFRMVVTPEEGAVARTDPCRVYWGSHGCRFEREHAGLCECSCCDCPDDHHNGIEAPYLVDDDGVLCVSRAPYYGPETRFYGEDVEARGLPTHDDD